MPMSELLLVIQWVFFVGLCALHLRIAGPGIFHPNVVYSLFHFIVFVVHPTLIALVGSNMYGYLHFYPDDSDIANTLIVTNVGYVVFMVVGWWTARRVDKQTAFPLPRSGVLPPIDDSLKRSFRWTLLLLAPLAIVPLGYNITHPILTRH